MGTAPVPSRGHLCLLFGCFWVGCSFFFGILVFFLVNWISLLCGHEAIHLSLFMSLVKDFFNRLFCFAHHELSKAHHGGMACTPAMARGLTDHVWSVGELLTYKLAPPPWVEPSRRGPPRKRPVSDPEPTRWARVRLRKGVLCSVTS